MQVLGPLRPTKWDIPGMVQQSILTSLPGDSNAWATRRTTVVRQPCSSSVPGCAANTGILKKYPEILSFTLQKKSAYWALTCPRLMSMDEKLSSPSFWRLCREKVLRPREMINEQSSHPSYTSQLCHPHYKYSNKYSLVVPVMYLVRQWKWLWFYIVFHVWKKTQKGF